MASKPRAEAAAKVVTIRLSPMELRRACEAAVVNRQTVSAFVRESILDATSQCLEEGTPFPKDERGGRCNP